MYLTSPESDTDLEALLSSVVGERYTKASEIANKVTESARGNHEISPNGSATPEVDHRLQEAGVL